MHCSTIQLFYRKNISGPPRISTAGCHAQIANIRNGSPIYFWMMSNLYSFLLGKMSINLPSRSHIDVQTLESYCHNTPKVVYACWHLTYVIRVHRFVAFSSYIPPFTLFLRDQLTLPPNKLKKKLSNIPLFSIYINMNAVVSVKQVFPRYRSSSFYKFIEFICSM